MEESRQVCCCGVDRWTKVIAWLEIVGSVFGTLFFAFIIFVAISKGRTEVEEAVRKSENPEVQMFRNVSYGAILTLFVISLMVCLVTLFMGVVLWKGAKKRDPITLKYWIIFALAGLILDLILKVGTLTTAEGVVGNIFGIIVTILVSGFFIWIVHTFRKEIMREEVYNDCGIEP